MYFSSKSLFEELLIDDVVYVKPVVERFKNYYVNRFNQGLITDKDVDERIEKACLENDIKVIMTSSEHKTGTDRIGEVARKIEAKMAKARKKELIKKEMLKRMNKSITLHY